MSESLNDSLSRHTQLWLLVLCIGAFLLTYLAPVDASFSDPWGTLLTAQAIVEHGTIQLDRYTGDKRYLYEPIEPAANGHYYNYFPLGSSVFALPAVWLARLRGENMLYMEDNRALQNALSSLTVVACTLLIFALCRQYLSTALSLGATVAFVFGTSVVSTLGSAYWSSNSTLVLGLACVLVLVIADRTDAGRGTEAGLGAMAFSAYFCRPTMALLVLVLGVYMAVRWRRIPIGFGATIAGLFGLFVAFSWNEYGLLLPPYYQPSRLGHSHFWPALWGHLISPSRGLFVATPYFLLTVAGLLIWWRRLLRQRLVAFCLAWLGLHWLAISSFHHWWGGWSFGNRLFADALPAAFLLTLLVARTATQQLAPLARGIAAAAFLLCGAFAIFVHAHQGLYNPYTVMWSNGIDRNEARVFDWQHPQFLAGPAMLGLHERDHVLLAMAPYTLGEAILPGSDSAIFEGWSIPEGGGAWRWSNGYSPSILFKVEEPLPDATEMTLALEMGTYDKQLVHVAFNGAAVGTIRSEQNWEPSTYEITIPAEVLARSRRPLPGGRILRLDLEVPGAQLVGEGSAQRRLGICLRRMTFGLPQPPVP